MCGVALSLLVCGPLAAADADFVGTWTLGVVFDDSGSPEPRSRRADALVIRQTPSEIIVQRSGDDPVAFRKDGAESLYDEGGRAAPSERRNKVRTQLIRLGPAFVTRTTPVREEVDARSGVTTLVAGATTTEVFTLSADRRYLAVARTARRDRTPEMPHDRLVEPDADFSDLRTTEVFVRSGS